MAASSLTFVSLMAGNADSIYQQLVAELAAASGLAIAFDANPSWVARARLLRDGHAELGAICGATYAQWTDHRQAALELLAAPVMAGPRYAGQPVYFSDLVVRYDSARRTFAELRGARLAYNEAESFSGSIILAAELAARGETAEYFASLYATGSHQESLRQVLRGAADTAAIDSIVLERELGLCPELAPLIRSVATLGPNPAPPLVAARRLPRRLRERLRSALLELHARPSGQAILAASQISRFAAITDADYDPIRHQIQRAEALEWPPQPVLTTLF